MIRLLINLGERKPLPRGTVVDMLFYTVVQKHMAIYLTVTLTNLADFLCIYAMLIVNKKHKNLNTAKRKCLHTLGLPEKRGRVENNTLTVHKRCSIKTGRTCKIK